MSAADRVERARLRIEAFAQRRPEAVRLARFASLAVRVDAPLLRTLRLALVPESDAGTEADLWFSPLTESVSSQGFVMDPDVVDRLRQELAEIVVDGRQRALNRAAGLIRRSHEHWPASLQIEERITWLSLRRALTAVAISRRQERVEQLLRQMLKAMTDDAARGTEIARWAQRALRRLPVVARETDAALLLALGAAERLQMPIVLLDADRQQNLPEGAGWVLPSGRFSTTTTIGVRRYLDGVEFLTPDLVPPEMVVTLPRTTPLYLAIAWSIGTTRTAQTISVEPGRRVAVPAGATNLRFRTLADEELEVESAGAVNTPPQAPPVADLGLACVRVTQGSDHKVEFAGFFLTADTVLTLALRADESHIGKPVTVSWRGGHATGTVVATQDDGAVVHLARAVRNATVLPIATATSSVEPGAPWLTVVLAGDTSVVRIDGAIRAVNVESPDRHTGLIELTTHADTQSLAIGGAPVILDGVVIAYLVMRGTVGASSEPPPLYARPIRSASALVARGVRPDETTARVYLSYAPEDSLGKGLEMDERPLERVRASLEAAGLQSVPPDLAGSRSGERVAEVISGCAGGVIFVTPISHHQPDVARAELQSLAYRRWAKPDFPIAQFCFRTDGLVAKSPVPPALKELPRVDLEKTPEAELTAYMQRAFGSTRARMTEAEVPIVPFHLQVKVFRKESLGEFEQTARRSGLRSWNNRWLLLLEDLARDEQIQVIDNAAMYSFPPETHGPLAEVASGVSNHRLFRLNATSPETVAVLLRRAWIGQAPPRSILIEERAEDTSPAAIVGRVADVVAQDLDCTAEEARWCLEHVTSPFFLTVDLRLLPITNWVSDLLSAMPGALLFFLTGDGDVEPAWSPDMVALPPLPPKAEAEFLSAYRYVRTMASARPADAWQNTASDQNARATTSAQHEPPSASATVPQSEAAPQTHRPRAKSRNSASKPPAPVSQSRPPAEPPQPTKRRKPAPKRSKQKK